MREKKVDLPQKKSSLYLLTLIIWMLLLFVSMPGILNDAFSQNEWYATVFLIFNVIVISYFWLNGIKDLCYIFYFHLGKNKRIKYETSILENNFYKLSLANGNPKVAMVYVTCDDFMPQSLELSMHQTYENTEVYILDDSRKTEFKKIS